MVNLLQDSDLDDELKELNRTEAAGNLEKQYGKELDGDSGIKDAQKELDEKEGSPNPPSTWDASGYTGGAKTKGKFKRAGPITTIVIVIATAITGGAAFFAGPSLLLNQVYETFSGTARLNPQLTSLTVRTDNMIASKFSPSTTSGICTTKLTILCKYTRPSNRLLTQMEKYGIKAYDGKNGVITKGLFPNTRPTTLVFTDSTGKELTVTADKVASTMASNPEFRAAMRNAYNPRFVSLADSVFAKVKALFGFSGQDKAKSDTTPDKVSETLGEESAGVDEAGAGAAAKEGDSALISVIRKLFNDQIADQLAKIAKAGESGSAEGLIAGGVCAVTDVPGLITKVVRTYQLAQVIKYAAVFLIVAGAIRAGDATSTETSALGALLTTTVGGKSAMDSFGMRNALFGDTSPGSDNVWSTFVPGAGVLASLGVVAAILDSGVKKQICSAATSPFAGAVTDAALAPETLGIGTVINIALGVGLGATLAAAGPTIAGAVSGLIPDSVYSSIMNYFVGDLTAPGGTPISGQSVGDAVASGAENMMSQTANAGGNMPLSVNDAVAYNQVTQQVDLAYAQDDRVDLSPLDASNPNTELGSFVNQFLPYYGDLSSVSGILSMIGSVATNPISSLLSSSTAGAADPATEFNQCPDPSIQATGTAATPFCAIQYGIPTEYLNISPTQVITDLQQTGNIDEDGNPTDPPSDITDTASSDVFGISPGTDTSTLKDWTSLCTDGSEDAISDTGNECMITDRKTAEFALYTVDMRVEQTMDGEDTTLDTGSSDPSSTDGSTDSTDDTSAYSPNSLFALLDTFNQPQVSLPKLLPSQNQPTQPLVAAATIANKFAAVAVPVKRYGGIIA